MTESVDTVRQQSAKRARIMFICIGNSCRSPMAESIAIRDASDLIEACSAGLSPLGVVQKQTLETLQRNGYPTASLQSKAIGKAEWDAADLVINMSGYHKQRAFPRSDWDKVEDWDVDDPYGSESQVYQRTFKDIRTRMEALIARLRAARA